MTRFIRQLCGLLTAFALAVSIVIPAHADQDELLSVDEESAAMGEGYYIELPEESAEDSQAAPTDPDAAAQADPPSGKRDWTEVYTHEFPLYSQLDYPNQRYGSGTIATSGCSITSLAMVASYLTGHAYYPDELAKYFGGYGENNVQRLEYAAQQLKLPIHKADTILDVFAAMKNGDVAILLMNHMSIFTETQHFIVLTGINEETGKYMVYDSYPPNYEKWDLKRGFVEGFEEKDLMLGYCGGWIFSIRGMPEIPFIYTEEKPEADPRYGVELTWDEQQLLAKLIWLEARGESKEGQQAVAEVALNRLVSGEYGDTLSEVIYGEGQFRTTPFLDEAEAWQAQYEAIDAALDGPNILPMDVMHFATYPENDRVWGKIGGHIFCYG
ncbi:MAG: cell wall hydrolase [Clostridiales bacterium]|nr:cell wall hydrolase [Clostridiales bacterium]